MRLPLFPRKSQSGSGPEVGPHWAGAVAQSVGSGPVRGAGIVSDARKCWFVNALRGDGSEDEEHPSDQKPMSLGHQDLQRPVRRRHWERKGRQAGRPLGQVGHRRQATGLRGPHTDAPAPILAHSRNVSQYERNDGRSNLSAIGG